mmetsp:Transcript_44734/g.107962  ORF Transcript_44734/g.107962 Transcript_44734/m.107962 type:complete len:221 (+) Transcript_44734:2097-2759(+)
MLLVFLELLGLCNERFPEWLNSRPLDRFGTRIMIQNGSRIHDRNVFRFDGRDTGIFVDILPSRTNWPAPIDPVCLLSMKGITKFFLLLGESLHDFKAVVQSGEPFRLDRIESMLQDSCRKIKGLLFKRSHHGKALSRIKDGNFGTVVFASCGAFFPTIALGLLGCAFGDILFENVEVECYTSYGGIRIRAKGEFSEERKTRKKERDERRIFCRLDWKELR